MCPTNTTLSALAVVRPLPSAAGYLPFPPMQLSAGVRVRTARAASTFVAGFRSYPGERNTSTLAAATIFPVTGSEILPQLLWRCGLVGPARQVRHSLKKHGFRCLNTFP